MGRQGHLLTRKPEHLSRKLDENVDQVQVPQAAELAVTDHFDSGYFMRFQSREGIFNQILEALQDDNISLMALHGEHGSGRQTLAKQIGKRAKELNILNLVVFVRVATLTPNLKRIQGDIADQLGLRLGEEADLAARQTQIMLRLRNEERVLIILVDVWVKLDLQKIGISNDGSQMGCKLLLTTPSREVGFSMRCQLSLQLYLLTDEEAWHLLRKHAGIDYGSPDLISAAIEVTKHCNGSPLVISVLGSALRGKTVDQWMQVLTTLRSPTGKDWERVYWFRILQMGYNGLSSRVAKTILLVCGFFPAYHEILIEDLSQYAVRLGLCSKSEARAAIDTLKDSSLLLHSDTSKDHVIIHRLVHCVAMVIAQRENPTYGDSIHEYTNALYNEEDFEWHEELYRLLRQLYGVSEYPSSSTRNATFHGGEGRELQVVRSYSYTKAAAIPKPSGKLVDFFGLCRVDKSFLPLLKEACAMKPQLIESQRRHSEMLRQSAFDCLGRLLFLLHEVRNRDWVHHKHELQMFWEQAQAMKFDLEWLSPTVEGVFSSADIARIETLREEEKYWNEEAAKLREQLKIVENKAADVRTEIALTKSKLDGFAIAMGGVSKAQVVLKVTPSWKKLFFKK